MAYIRGDREQHLLFPPSVEDFIPPDDPVRAYDAFVEQLDLNHLGIFVDDKQAGPPEFDPRVMLKILVYGTAYGIRTSRKLERACHHNLSFIWLKGNIKPDHMTIARFRRNHRDGLSKILKQCARLCLKLGLVEGNTLFVNGTKIKANASVDHSWHKDRCEDLLKLADQKIIQTLGDMEKLDQKELFFFYGFSLGLAVDPKAKYCDYRKNKKYDNYSMHTQPIVAAANHRDHF